MPLERLYDTTDVPPAPDALYAALRFPEPPPGRPYAFLNMVSTADGKTLIAPRGSTAAGVGGPTDQMLMRRIREAADAVMLGAGTLRPEGGAYPPRLWRAVVTRSGDLPLDNRFFTEAPGRAIVFAPETLPPETRERLGTRAQVRIVGETTVDIQAAVGLLRAEFGVERLLLEGGPTLNFELFQAGVVDELFLTLAPKIKGGAHLPTVVDGPGLPERQVIALDLLSLYRDGSELYLRYHVKSQRVNA